MEYITRGVCGQEGCRETRYYLDNGLWFCRRGHLQEGRQVEEDPDDFGIQGKKHRLKKVVAEKGQKTYRGRQAYTLFLQVYQLILWKQSYALVHDRGFPTQLENVVRDLWALRLETYSDKIISSTAEADEEEPELFSSQPTATFAADEDSKSGGRKLLWPRLIDSIALCYLGTLLLRLPVGIGDFHRMVMREEIPYIRIVKSIPREMRDKLPQEYLALIETRSIPKSEHLHKSVLELTLLYHREFGVSFPSLNAPLILFRYIKSLALPVEIYPAVRKLQELVGYSYTFPTSILGKRRHLHLPEVQLVALIVVATKLFFPFDTVKRYPASLSEPAVQVIDWVSWAQAQRQFDRRETAGGKIGKGNEILVSEKDVFEMTLSQLDEYMDWYENSWVDHSNASATFADMFPTNRTAVEIRSDAPQSADGDDEAITSKLRTVMSQLRLRRAISDANASNLENEIPRPGSLYERYRTESELPETARPFYEAVAKLVGVTLPTLVRAVFQTEYKMSRWQEEQRRMEYHGELPEMEPLMNASDDDIEGLDDQGLSD